MTETEATTPSTELDWWTGNHARVFVSCGQAKKREREIASSIRTILKNEKFSTYVGVETHSTAGLNENIFRYLTSAEYVVFIDFPEQPPDFHQSTFSRQELAIALLVGSDFGSGILPFHPRGTELQGMLKFAQGNAIEYDNPDELPGLVLESVRREGWDCLQRRELRIEPSPNPPGMAGIARGFTRQIPPGDYRFFELVLKNMHHTIMATDCIVQIVGCSGPSFDDGAERDLVEMKFKHMVNPSIVLPPGQRRQFDGIVVRATTAPDPFMPLACPGILNPGHIDSEEIIRQYLMTVPGDHVFDVQVHSREFGTQDATLLFHFDRDPVKCRLSVGPARPKATQPEIHRMRAIDFRGASGTLAGVMDAPESGSMPIRGWEGWGGNSP